MEPPGEASEPTQAVSPGVGVPYENTKTYHSPYNTSPYVVPENERTPPAYIPPGTPVEYGEPVEIVHG